MSLDSISIDDGFLFSNNFRTKKFMNFKKVRYLKDSSKYLKDKKLLAGFYMFLQDESTVNSRK